MSYNVLVTGSNSDQWQFDIPDEGGEWLKANINDLNSFSVDDDNGTTRYVNLDQVQFLYLTKNED